MKQLSRRQWLYAAAVTAMATACGAPLRGAAGKAIPTKAANDLLAAKTPKYDANLTSEENSRPGDRRWRIDRIGAANEIEGWAGRASVKSGEPVDLHISTTAPRYRITAFRTGWYAGTQGRMVWRSGPLNGQLGTPAKLISGTNAPVTDWPVTITVDTAGWVPGFYSFRLDASTGGQRYIPLAVRSGDAKGKIVLLNGDTTWQAYNPYGGYSLYRGPDGSFATRARAVSFDRPYGGYEGAQGDSEFQANLLPLLSLVERLGLPAEYLSDTDLHDDPHAIDGALAVLSPGHDEYYSTLMRDRLEAARDVGVNLAFFGSNAIYRHVRLDKTPIGRNRLMTCYKIPEEDPFFGHNSVEATGQWRNPPNARPESVLTGVFYESNPVKADMVIRNPSHWLFAGSDVTDGTVLPNLVGPEYDRVTLDVATPRPIEVLARSPLVCAGRSSHSDMAYYTTPSGAAVFSTGTNWWINAISGASGRLCQKVTARVTTNLLHAFMEGPTGKRHPAVDNLAQL